jgi:hypothetical protein
MIKMAKSKKCQFCGRDVNLMEWATFNGKPCHTGCWREAKAQGKVRETLSETSVWGD